MVADQNSPFRRIPLNGVRLFDNPEAAQAKANQLYAEQVS